MATPQQFQQGSPSSRPQLPSKFAEELRKRYVKQQQRKIRTQTLPSPSVNIPLDDYVSFSEYLKSSTRILALFGAGLSAPSGIPTFRGAGGFWREYDCMELATPGAFFRDPSLVWQFNNYRRHIALQAQPNRAHVALAELARRKPQYLAINQNIDGLSERAKHPATNMQRIHGSLFETRCMNRDCTYVKRNDLSDPIVPALELSEEYDISDPKFPLKEISREDLPHCPQCSSLLRPDIVWFGESLNQSALDRIHEWVDKEKVDLMLVVGTSALVWPAAGYIHTARTKGAKVAVFNMEEPDNAGNADWFFKGDAALTVPELLKEVIGVVPTL